MRQRMNRFFHSAEFRVMLDETFGAADTDQSGYIDREETLRLLQRCYRRFKVLYHSFLPCLTCWCCVCMCLYVYVCVCSRVCVCACVCARARVCVFGSVFLVFSCFFFVHVMTGTFYWVDGRRTRTGGSTRRSRPLRTPVGFSISWTSTATECWKRL